MSPTQFKLVVRYPLITNIDATHIHIVIVNDKANTDETSWLTSHVYSFSDFAQFPSIFFVFPSFLFIWHLSMFSNHFLYPSISTFEERNELFLQVHSNLKFRSFLFNPGHSMIFRWSRFPRVISALLQSFRSYLN